MKITSILAIAFFVAAVSAAPRPHNRKSYNKKSHKNANKHFNDYSNKNKEITINKEKNYKYVDNSVNNGKTINQIADNVGSSGGKKGGLVDIGLLNKNSQSTNFSQNASIS